MTKDNSPRDGQAGDRGRRSEEEKLLQLRTSSTSIIEVHSYWSDRPSLFQFSKESGTRITNEKYCWAVIYGSWKQNKTTAGKHIQILPFLRRAKQTSSYFAATGMGQRKKARFSKIMLVYLERASKMSRGRSERAAAVRAM